MTPKRCCVCALTTTMAAPGVSRRYSSAMSSAGTLMGMIVQTSRSAILRSVSSASLPPRRRTLGFCMVSSDLSALIALPNEAHFAARSAARVGAAPLDDRGVVLVLLVVPGGPVRALASHEEELEVARVVLLVVGRQRGQVVRRHGLREPRRDD